MRLTARKIAVNIKAICDGHISKQEVMDNLQMSEEEINSLIDRWEKYGHYFGWQCLRTTRIQEYR